MYPGIQTRRRWCDEKANAEKRDGAIWLVAPMAIWTILFVVATLGYILYLSFSTRAENGMGVRHSSR